MRKQQPDSEESMPRGRAKSTGKTVKPAGVTFEAGVLDYLEQLSNKEDRSRSWLINRIVKEHAAKNGIAIESFKPILASE